MFAGVSIVCFAASYAVALVLETTRLLFRSGVRGAAMLGFGAAGLLAHTMFLSYRAYVAVGAQQTPLSSQFDWYLVAAWVLTSTYLIWTLYYPKTAIGLFVLPLVLAMIAKARWFSSTTPMPRSQAHDVWMVIHLGFQLAGTVAVIVGFVGGLMCLVQAWRLKHKLPPTRGLRLPSLESLERLNTRAIVLSGLLLGTGFLCGIVLNLIDDRVPWSDPVIWRSGMLVGWLVAAALFTAFYKPVRQGRKSAYLTVATFVLLVLSQGIELLLPTQHGSRPNAEADVRSGSHVSYHVPNPTSTFARGGS